MFLPNKILIATIITIIILVIDVNAMSFPVKVDNLKVRTAPSLNAKIVRIAGPSVDVTCQTTGDTVMKSNIWDKLTDGNFVSDYYVKTGTDGFVSGLSRCENSPPSSNNNGKINEEGLGLIKNSEGFRPNFYGDSVGVKTIGFGHSCRANSCGSINPPITRAQGEALLTNDLIRFEKCVNSLTTFRLNSDQFSALVSFTFNLGCGAYGDSTLRKKLNAGDTKGASLEFGKFVHAGGKVFGNLIRRREAERVLFCKSGGC